MEHLMTPQQYEPLMDIRETEVAIKLVKDFLNESWPKT